MYHRTMPLTPSPLVLCSLENISLFILVIKTFVRFKMNPLKSHLELVVWNIVLSEIDALSKIKETLQRHEKV